MLITTRIPVEKFNNRKIANNQDYFAYKRLFIGSNAGCDIYTKSVPSFSAINGGRNFRKLVNIRQIHCIYCGRPMISEKQIAKLKKDGAFSGSISDFVQALLPFIDCMHDAEKEFFKKITLMCFKTPTIKLSEAVKNMYNDANRELVKEQKPILDKIAGYASFLPKENRKDFQKLMHVTMNRFGKVNYIPEEFSGKEFTYKMKRLCDSVQDKNNAKKIISIVRPLAKSTFKLHMEPLNKKQAKKILEIAGVEDVDVNTLTKEKLMLIMIQKAKSIGMDLKRKDIIELCDIGEKTINHEPVVIKFSNKAFRYDLVEALASLKDDALKQEIYNVSLQLPDSRTSVNAFITKHENSSSEAIGYDVLRPSIVTIEHMLPKSKMGPSAIYNYSLACFGDNNSRRDMDMSEFIKQFNIKNQQKYFTEIIDEVKNGNLTVDTVKRMINIFARESKRNMQDSLDDLNSIERLM